MVPRTAHSKPTWHKQKENTSKKPGGKLPMGSFAIVNLRALYRQDSKPASHSDRKNFTLKHRIRYSRFSKIGHELFFSLTEEDRIKKMSDVLCAYNMLFLEKYRPEVGLLSDPASSRAAPWPPSNRIIRCSRDTGAEVSCSNQSQGSSL